MRDVWESWEDWFRMLGVTHSVLPMLSMWPSAQNNQSWVLAAAAVLDAATLAASSMNTEDAESARICVRTGTRALLAMDVKKLWVACCDLGESPQTTVGRTRILVIVKAI